MSYVDDLEKLCKLKEKKLITEAEFEVQKAHLLKQVKTKNDIAIGSKSRITYVVLGLFLGGFGIHDFYAKRTITSFIHLILQIIGVVFVVLGLIQEGHCDYRGDEHCCFLYAVYSSIGLIALLINYIWLICDLCIIRKDGAGKNFI